MESRQARTWMMLVYKVPREPTSARAAVWRKLKKLGALLLHDAVWVLPATPWTREQFQWLVVEIVELDGEAHLWESRLVLNGQDDTLVQKFQTRVDTAYQEILTELEHEQVDLIALSRRYQQIQAQDYFQSEVGKQVRARLLEARGGRTS